MPTVFEVRVGLAPARDGVTVVIVCPFEVVYRVGARSPARVGAEAVTRPRSASARCGGIERVGPSLAPGLVRVGGESGLVRRGPSAIGDPGAPGEGPPAPLGAPGLAVPPGEGGWS